MPASLSPFFTGKSPWREAIIISPRELTASSFFLSILNSPSIWAFSSIFPSFISDSDIYSFLQISRRISAPSFSWRIPSVFSQTNRCSLPTDKRTGMSSSLTTWPFLNTGPFFSPLMICVISCREYVLPLLLFLSLSFPLIPVFPNIVKPLFGIVRKTVLILFLLLYTFRAIKKVVLATFSNYFFLLSFLGLRGPAP